ncbi:MAG: SDR family NAD(P)-dependent oxidoreductase [marine benthic group bacterium]|nr:SDR family NAD(P)-dependent oxidoreductase [Candidatus Carthagonibacter metallireducens]MCL7982466.1 SDR family NAD(P)-dependent oxidoreductase [Gemmatimonadota bacterium]
MDGRLALITGASAGIGAATARRFAAEGADLVLWARRQERLEALADELRSSGGVEIHTQGVDVRDRAAVDEASARLLSEVGTPDFLLNNAGLASGLSLIQEGDPEDWDRMIDTNLKGLLNVTRAILPSMVERGTGHVINIGSTAGHQVYPKGNVYNATKFGVRALTEGMNLDVAGTRVRVSSVDPGFVETEFSVVRFHGDEERAESVYEGFEPLTADDVADVVAFVATRPPHVNVHDVVLLPTAQRNVYVLDRKSE